MGDPKRDGDMIVVVIPAKADSTRLADKNLRRINEVTLIEHAVRYARDSQRIDAVYVSTDSKAIAALARELAEATTTKFPFRPSRVASSTPSARAWSERAWSSILDANSRALCSLSGSTMPLSDSTH